MRWRRRSFRCWKPQNTTAHLATYQKISKLCKTGGARKHPQPPVFATWVRSGSRPRVVRFLPLSYTRFHEEKRGGEVCALVGGSSLAAGESDARRVPRTQMGRLSRAAKGAASGS